MAFVVHSSLRICIMGESMVKWLKNGIQEFII
jgi:hypothetical protein